MPPVRHRRGPHRRHGGRDAATRAAGLLLAARRHEGHAPLAARGSGQGNDRLRLPLRRPAALRRPADGPREAGHTCRGRGVPRLPARAPRSQSRRAHLRLQHPAATDAAGHDRRLRRAARHHGLLAPRRPTGCRAARRRNSPPSRRRSRPQAWSATSHTSGRTPHSTNGSSTSRTRAR